MPQLPGGHAARGDRYELTGVVDVISSVQAARDAQNPIVQVIHAAVPPLAQVYDLIVDYKSMRRPPAGSSSWQHHEWQVQTYAWLRAQAPGTVRVGAGLIVYINELAPFQTDLLELKDDIRNNRTDVFPSRGTADYYALTTWVAGQPLPNLNLQFRLQRALQIIDVAAPNVAAAVANIDNVVVNIEQSAALEFSSGVIPQNWTACGSDRDCDACDFRHFCPSPAPARQPGGNWRATPPAAPG